MTIKDMIEFLSLFAGDTQIKNADDIEVDNDGNVYIVEKGE